MSRVVRALLRLLPAGVVAEAFAALQADPGWQQRRMAGDPAFAQRVRFYSDASAVTR